MSAPPGGRSDKTAPQILLPSRFAAALSQVPGVVAGQYESIEEACTTPGEWDAVWLGGFASGSGVTHLLRRGTKLRWVHYSSTGVEHLPLGLFRARDVVLTNGAGLYAEPIAEHVVMCMLAARLNLLGVLRAQAAASWMPEVESDQELSGSVTLILGYGQLGRAVATRLIALGVTVLAARRSGELGPSDGIVPANAWRDHLPDADFLVLTLPSTKETHAIIGAAELAAMKPGAWLVNVARGNLVDEPALLDALLAGRLGGAVLDAFVQEPLPPEHLLWQLENVIISPHSSWRSSHLDRRQVELFSDNLERFLAGRSLRNVVDLEAGY